MLSQEGESGRRPKVSPTRARQANLASLMNPLDSQLAALPQDVRDRLSRYGFDAARLVRLAEPLRHGVAADNFVQGSITPPAPGDVVELPQPGPPSTHVSSSWGARR